MAKARTKLGTWDVLCTEIEPNSGEWSWEMAGATWVYKENKPGVNLVKIDESGDGEGIGYFRNLAFATMFTWGFRAGRAK